MSTIAVVDVITEYLMTFEPLFGDKKKEVFYLYVRTIVKKINFAKIHL